MAHTIGGIRGRILVQIIDAEPIELATFDIDTRTDLVADPADDTHAIALTTLPEGWAHGLADTLQHCADHLRGVGRPHLHS